MKKAIVLVALSILMIGCSKKEINKTDGEANCHCEGTGDYTIVMEAGMGNWSIFYQPIFEKLKATTQICILDRAGYQLNQSTNKARDAKTIALEINAILMEKGITDNIIIMGHSMGGLQARMYQSLYPEKVDGMILMESAHPDQFSRLPKEFSDLQDKQIENMDKVIKKAQKGWLEKSNKSIPTYELPENLLEDYYAITEQPEYYNTFKEEAVYFEQSLKQVKGLTDINDIPLLVIASKNSLDIDLLSKKEKKYPFADHNAIWLTMQKEIATLSNNSTFVTSEKNHYLHISDANLVADAIKAFYEANF